MSDKLLAFVAPNQEALNKWKRQVFGVRRPVAALVWGGLTTAPDSLNHAMTATGRDLPKH
jgi:hypothetical protein